MNLLFRCLLILIVANSIKVKAQETHQFNIGVYSGLPSDMVYGLMVDHLGYLWLSTYNGVARYNGYDLKVYDLSKGFSTREVWRTFEDKTGKIWLYGISSYLGYIYNDEYHRAYNLVDTNSGFYPRFKMQNTQEGICFINIAPHKNDYSFIKVHNDTIISKFDLGYNIMLSNIKDENHILTLRDSGLVYLTTITGKNSSAQKVGSFKFIDFIEDPIYNVRQFAIGNCTSFGRFTFSKSSSQDKIYILDFDKFTATNSDSKKLLHTKQSENVNLIFEDGDYLTFITDSSAYWLDSNLNLVKSASLQSLLDDIRGTKIILLLNDQFWGGVIATNNHGIYVDYGKDTSFKKITSFNIRDYTYLGCIGDTITYWQNRLTSHVTRVLRNKYATYENCNLKNISGVMPYNKDSGLILTYDMVYKFDYKSFKYTEYLPFGAIRLFFSANDSFYSLHKFFGLFKTGLTRVSGDNLEKDRFKDMVYDSVRGDYWLFNSGRVLRYSPVGGLKSYNSRDLSLLGINNIENLLVDTKYGNLFILEDKRLLMFDDINKPYQLLFGNFILDNAVARIYKNQLIVAGDFGLFSCKILGKGKLSAPIVYPNRKKMIYYRVNNMEVSNNEVLLNTDKGIYLLNLPADDAYNFSSDSFRNSPRLIIGYNDSNFCFKGRDTLKIIQKNDKILFDLIKPDGAGQVKYLYRLSGNDTSWNELNRNELNLPKLAAGKYYHLKVVVFDNQWRSNPYDICLFVVPYWYETTIGQLVIWCSSFLIIIALIYLVFSVTKRMVTRNSEKKQAQLELELKSVYSQLNPHFIFNSLGAAMYLVKKNRTEDAYKHIYKFSQLLRSYIKSSRNRFIPLAEELINLEHYIELQQSRFKDRFVYEIKVETGLDTGINIPSLLIQPLVENAIAHGLLPKESVGHLRIEIRKGAGVNEVDIIIEDDGIGRKQSQMLKEQNNIKQESYGSLLIKDLIDILNKYEEVKISLEYIDKIEPETGTIVNLYIKNQSK